MIDTTLLAAQINQKATLDGAWVQALATLGAAILAGGIAYLTVLKPITDRKREKTKQILLVLLKVSREGWNQAGETIQELQRTLKRIDEFKKILEHCRINIKTKNSWVTIKYLERGCVDLRDVELFADISRHLTETDLGLNNYMALSPIAVAEPSDLDPEIVQICLNDERTSLDLDLLGSRAFDTLLELRSQLSKLRFQQASFQQLAEKYVAEITTCYVTCDKFDILLTAYEGALLESQSTSAKLEKLCEIELTKIEKGLKIFTV
jgi:hypothetical protein